MDFARPDVLEAALHLSVYRELQETGAPGGLVCLTKVGRYPCALTNCYGFQDATKGLVLDPHTSLFDLGGCAKVLAALALLRALQERGLTVAAEVKFVLPPGLQVDTSRYGSVTLQHLLTHTSGLQRGGSGGVRAGSADGDAGPNGTDGSGATGGAHDAVSLDTEAGAPASPRPAAAPSPEAAEASRAEVGDNAADTPVMSYLRAQHIWGVKPPGVYRPQDVDYMLLGAVIEHLTGEQYDNYVRRTLLQPLGVLLSAAANVCGAGGAHPESDDGQAWASVYAYVTRPPPRSAGDGGGVGAGPAAPAGGTGGEVAGFGEGAAVGSVTEEAITLSGGSGGLAPAPARERLLVRYPPPPLTPVGGLVLTARDVTRLLPLFIQAGGGPGGGIGALNGAADDDPGQAPPGTTAAVARNLLSTLCEIRLSDFLKDVGVAYGGLLSLGLARCGDSVVACESPPAPPSMRELVLTSQAAQAAAQAAALGPSEGAAPATPGQPVPPPPPPHIPSVGPPAGDGDVTSGTGATGGVDGARAGGLGGAVGPGGPGVEAPAGHSSLLVLALESGVAMLVCCNTAGREGSTFCRKIATKLLEQFRPTELPRAAVRSWVVPLPPPRQDTMTQLVVFPPACCPYPTAFFDGWPLLLPDYIKVHCVQAPGHGMRRGETCELRLPKLVPSAAASIQASMPGDAPLALFGHGLGALWAFEVARRLECLYRRPLLHLIVSACASPFSLAGRSPSGDDQEGATGAGTGAPAGEGGVGAQDSSTTARFEPWRHPDLPLAGDGKELYELPDDEFIAVCREHPRLPRQLRSNTKAVLEHMASLRADIEAEIKYTFAPPTPSLCASVQAALASVQNRSDEEARLTQGLLSCPITVLTPEEDTALGTAQTAGWDQVTTGQVRFQTVPGDYHCLDDRKHRAQVTTSITTALGRQMSVHVPWLAKLRPAGVGGRWAGGGGAGSGRPTGSGRPGSAAGAGASPGVTSHLAPMYPRG